MKYAPHINSNLPNNHSAIYPIHNVMVSYVAEWIKRIADVVSGKILVLLKNKRVKEAHVQTSFKMKESLFVKRLNIRQSVKYGASVYLMATLLAMPAGVCSSQYTKVAPLPDNNKPIQLPALISLLDQDATIQAGKDHAALQPDFHRYVIEASEAYGVDAALIRAIIMAESSNNPKAVSHRGAKGLMQLMPRTARVLGVKDSFNPAHNIDGGVRYVRQLLDRYKGNVKLALAAYNAGLRHVRNYGGVPPFKETHNYIKKVLNYRQHFEKALAACLFDTTSV